MNIEMLFDLAHQLNIAQLISIGAMFWFFNSRLEKKIEQVEARLEAKIDKLEARIDRVEARIDRVEARLDKFELRLNDIDKRLVIIETLLHMKDCCMLKDDRNMKKAE